MYKTSIIFIKCSYAYRNPKNTKHWRLSFGSGTKLLVPSLSLGFSARGERDTIFYADCSFIVSFQLTDSITQVRKINQISTHCFYSKSLRIPALMSAPDRALSRKVLSLTEPKDKIYKTKNDNIKKKPSAIIQQQLNQETPTEKMGERIWHWYTILLF